MAKVPHCKYCGKPILDKTQAIKKSNGWYCNLCYEKIQKEKESKMSDYKKLIGYLNELYDGDIPTYTFVQIADYKKNYNMKYSGMLLCLKYCFEELGMEFDNSKGIGILLYKYDECKKNWLKEQEVKKAVENFEFDDKEVVVNKRFDSNKLKYKPIDMEDL